MGWSKEVLQKVVKRKLRGSPVNSIRLEKIECCRSVMNELLEFCEESVSVRDGGLQQLRLSEFQAKI